MSNKPEIKQTVVSTGNKITGNLEDVRWSPTFRPALEGLASDISGIEYFIVEPKNDWQTAVWQNWIDRGLSRIMKEMCEKAWVYGHCIAVPETSVFFYGGREYIYPNWFTPLDMSRVSIRNGMVKYKTEEIDLEEVMRFEFFTDSGQVKAMGEIVLDPCVKLKALRHGWPSTTLMNSAGSLLFFRDKEASLSEIDQQEIAKFMNQRDKNYGMSMIVPSGISSVQMVNSSSKYLDYRAAIEDIIFTLLGTIRAQWLMSGISTPGNYGTVKATRQAAIEYTEFLADLVIEGLNDMVRKVAKWNGELPTIEIDHKGVAVDNDVDADLKFLQAVGVLIDMTPSLDAEQKRILYEQIGLPPPQPPKAEVTPEPKADIETLKSFFDNKKGAWLNLVLQDSERDKHQHIRLNGKNTIKDILNISDDKMTIFNTVWAQFEDMVNEAAKSDDPEAQFEAAWVWFIGEVQKWI